MIYNLDNPSAACFETFDWPVWRLIQLLRPRVSSVRYHSTDLDAAPNSNRAVEEMKHTVSGPHCQSIPLRLATVFLVLTVCSVGSSIGDMGSRRLD